jgi:hypothetical protein
VEAEQADASLGQTRATAVSPGEPLVPYEIVQHCRFYRDAGCHQIMEAEAGQRFEGGKLDHDSDGANQSELRRALNAGAPEKKLQATSRCSAFHEVFSSR